MNENNKLTEDERAEVDQLLNRLEELTELLRQDILEKGLHEDLRNPRPEE